MPGKFFVIDGTDGSGKATQTKLLVERMQAENYPVETISFPQYGKKSAGPVEEYLAGTYGTAKEVTAKQASILYAVDRFAASRQMKQQLLNGTHIVADRFVGSNMAHQGGKISDPQERAEFFRWNYDLEFGIFKLPVPDLNIILHVPAEISFQLLDAEKSGQRDIHEKDLSHLRDSEQAYLDLAKSFPEYLVVECAEQGLMLPIPVIHEKIWVIVKAKLASV